MSSHDPDPRLTENPDESLFDCSPLGPVLAAGGAFVLNSIQETAAQAETTGSARFNQDENVNSYGREAPSVYGR